MSYLFRWLERVERWALRLSVLAMFLMMAGITIDAGARYFLGQPLEGAFEATELYLMIVLVFLALPDTYSSGTQVRLEVTSRWLDRLPAGLVDRLGAALVAAVMGALTWFSAGVALEKFLRDETTLGAIQFPLQWSYVWVPLGCGLLTLRLALEALAGRRAGSREDG